MSRLIAVPNVSEGRDAAAVSRYADEIRATGARVLDVHTDAVHNRSVFTVAGDAVVLVESMTRLAISCRDIDLTAHSGEHPRLGGLDVCPFVPHAGTMGEAVEAARSTGRAIYERSGLPVYLYGEAARRAAARELRVLRRGGSQALSQRARAGLGPDHGSATEIDPRRGVVCVGARDVLIAFNVWLRCDRDTARRIAAKIREDARPGSRGSKGLRALGLSISTALSQVSMNIEDPAATPVDVAFEAVERLARAAGAPIVRTELVGLVPERFLPDPNAAAAQLLSEPGRSLEAALLGA